MFKRQKVLKGKTDAESKAKLDALEEEMATKMAENMYEIVKEEVEKVDSETGGFHSGHLWKLKSKLRPRPQSYPTAILDDDGREVTSINEINTQTEKHFHKVLADKPIKPELEEFRREREELCKGPV
jgi:hypothetical protein